MIAVINPNWPRWIKASVATAFTKIIEIDGGLELWVDGDDPRPTQELQDWAELRINGPDIFNTSVGVWRFMLEINVLINHNLVADDIYKMERNVGLCLSAFTADIPMLKLGDGVDDDGSVFGCMNTEVSLHDGLIISNYGKVEPDVNQQQSTISGYYRMVLT